MRTMYRCLTAGAGCVSVALLSGCPQPVTPQVTSVGKSVATLQKTSSITGCAGTTPPPLPVEPQDWWNAMPAANHQFPFAGWHAFQTGPGGCATVRVDAYRAVVTFNLASVSNLKGLVQSAELVVATRALPSAAGTSLNAGPLGQTGSINLFCVAMQGGAGSLVRFGPAAPAPTTSGPGVFETLGTNTFPNGTNTVYTFPANFVPGPIGAASNPTTAAPSGNGGVTYTSNVTSSVVAALNAGAAGMTWMLTSNFEGDLPAALTAPGETDCRTSYDVNLRITHL